MRSRVRISTSPPTLHETAEEEASYYCDIIEINDWRIFYIVRMVSPELTAVLRSRGLSSYIVHGPYSREIGIVICYEGDEHELMYCGIDYLGRVRCEPAVNEALWHVANVATALSADHRLERDLRGIFGVG